MRVTGFVPIPTVAKSTEPAESESLAPDDGVGVNLGASEGVGVALGIGLGVAVGVGNDTMAIPRGEPSPVLGPAIMTIGATSPLLPAPYSVRLPAPAL